MNPHTLAWPVKRHDSSFQVSAPKTSLDCGMVKKTQRRSPVRTSNACTVPGGSNFRRTRSGMRLPTITRSSNTTGGEVWSYSTPGTGRPWPSVSRMLPLSPKPVSSSPVAASIAYSRSRLFRKMRAYSSSFHQAMPRCFSQPCAPGPAFVGPGIENPEHVARLCVESRHTRVHGRQVQHIADHDGRCLERAGPGRVPYSSSGFSLGSHCQAISSSPTSAAVISSAAEYLVCSCTEPTKGHSIMAPGSRSLANDVDARKAAARAANLLMDENRQRRQTAGFDGMATFFIEECFRVSLSFQPGRQRQPATQHASEPGTPETAR